MIEKDLEQLTEIMNIPSELYAKEITPSLVELYFELLIEFSIEDIRKAFKAHVLSGENKDFYPKPGNINDIIKGSNVKLKPDDIIALALAKNTAVGVFAAAMIGSFDLANGSTTYLRGRAKEFLIDLDLILERVSTGNLTPRETHLLEKYHIDPLAPPAPGLPTPKLVRPNLKLVNKKTINKKDNNFDDDIPSPGI